MSRNLVDYLRREHARLEGEIACASRSAPDQVEIARLKKLKLAVRDQIAQMEREMAALEAA